LLEYLSGEVNINVEKCLDKTKGFLARKEASFTKATIYWIIAYLSLSPILFFVVLILFSGMK